MFETLREEIFSCRECEERFGFEPHPIVLGSEKSKIMHISQAPSKNVHQTRRPFDDASGKRLREEWYHISDEVFYNPKNFYFTSIAHCYPGKSPNGGDRLPPLSCARKWLHREMEIVDNKLFLLVGKKAADFFFPKQNFTELVFTNHELEGKPVYILPHPSPLNVKWFMDNPAFLEKRVFEVEEKIHEVLGIS